MYLEEIRKRVNVCKNTKPNGLMGLSVNFTANEIRRRVNLLKNNPAAGGSITRLMKAFDATASFANGAQTTHEEL